MRHVSRGVEGFHDPRFWIALACYGLAVPLLFEGGPAWPAFHVLMPALISFIIVSALAWDYRIIGNPRHSFCLILHIAFFVCMVFLLNRLMASGDFSRPLVGVPSVSGFADVLRRLPLLDKLYNLFDLVLKSMGFAIVLFFVSLAIIFRRRVALSLLAIFGMFFVALAVGGNLNASLWTLLAAIVLMTVAFRLQLEDERSGAFWSGIASRLRSSASRPRVDFDLQIAVLRRLGDAGELSEQDIRGIAASRLGCESNDPRLKPVCIRLLDQMIHQEGIAEAREGTQGRRLVLAVPEAPPDMFTSCARTVRALVVISFCIVYILSPIDLIPDATPVVGVVDDMLMGAVGLLSTVRTFWGGNRHIDRSVEYLPFDI